MFWNTSYITLPDTANHDINQTNKWINVYVPLLERSPCGTPWGTSASGWTGRARAGSNPSWESCFVLFFVHFTDFSLPSLVSSASHCDFRDAERSKEEAEENTAAFSNSFCSLLPASSSSQSALTVWYGYAMQMTDLLPIAYSDTFPSLQWCHCIRYMCYVAPRWRDKTRKAHPVREWEWAIEQVATVAKKKIMQSGDVVLCFVFLCHALVHLQFRQVTTS